MMYNWSMLGGNLKPGDLLINSDDGLGFLIVGVKPDWRDVKCVIVTYQLLWRPVDFGRTFEQFIQLSISIDRPLNDHLIKVFRDGKMLA